MTNRTFDLAYWINEREAMRLRREKGLPAPWSHDPDMATVRYCNVHREDDKVTRWIATNWRNPNANDVNLTLAMVAARMINWPETLDAIRYPTAGCDIPGWMIKAKDFIRLQQQSGSKTWTSAYTISTCGRKMKKEDYVFDLVLTQIADAPYLTDLRGLKDITLDRSHKELMLVDGLGSFLAAQVVADLKNTPGHPLSTATDYWTWSAHGPGSLRGLAAYYGRPVPVSSYQKAIRECYAEVVPLVSNYVGKIHMQDFQNCLCEFSKYMRVKEGDGRVRNKYAAG